MYRVRAHFEPDVGIGMLFDSTDSRLLVSMETRDASRRQVKMKATYIQLGSNHSLLAGQPLRPAQLASPRPIDPVYPNTSSRLEVGSPVAEDRPVGVGDDSPLVHEEPAPCKVEQATSYGWLVGHRGVMSV